MATPSNEDADAPPRVRIREARPDDAPTLLRLIHGSSNAVDHLDTAGLLDAITGIERSQYGFSLARCLVATDGPSIVGVACYHVFHLPASSLPTMRVNGVVVVPSRRRQRTGTRLMEALARQADLFGFGPMTWRVMATEAAAIRFSERLGGHTSDGCNYWLASDAVRWLALGLEESER